MNLKATDQNTDNKIQIGDTFSGKPSRLDIMKDESSVVIRKTRAQTIWDAFAREMTPVATKILSVINPESVSVDPVVRTYPRDSVSLASKSLQNRSETSWGFNQQLDFIIRILQDGLFCLNPELTKQITEQVESLIPIESESPSKELVSKRFSHLCNLLQNNSPFKLSDQTYDKIEQIIPDQFAYDDNNVDDKGDRRRLYKLSRILFFLRSYQNYGENSESFTKFFDNEVNRVLLGLEKPIDYSPSTQSEHEELFTRLNKHFDNTLIERFLDRAIKRFCPRSADQISFHKKSAIVNLNKAHSAESEQNFVQDNRHRPQLLKLAEELRNGHYSLVGGRDYTRMRFPEAILKRIALGSIKAVIVDGTLEEALDYVRNNYLDGAKDILQFQVCGQYGDFSKVYFRYQKGDKIEQLFLIAQPGESRVLSNAAALLNYAGKKDAQGKLLPEPAFIQVENIDCVYNKNSINDRVRDEIRFILDAITEEASILGKEELGLKTVLVPATSADTIIQTLNNLGYVEQWTDLPRQDTTGRVSVVVLQDPITSQRTRIILPSVGGSGLYGNTAGVFVSEYLKIISDYPDLHLSNDIKFFATAGAITSDALQPHEGQLYSPEGDFISYDFTQKTSSSRLKFNLPPIYKYNNHGWAPCPAVETSALFEYIQNNKETPLGLIDVEGLFIAKAVQTLGTFTPIYYVSDLIRPKSAGFDRHKPDFDSYAYGCRAGMAIRLSNAQARALVSYIFL
jgi:hypothetical protein